MSVVSRDIIIFVLILINVLLLYLLYSQSKRYRVTTEKNNTLLSLMKDIIDESNTIETMKNALDNHDSRMVRIEFIENQIQSKLKESGIDDIEINI